jgi:hypothetical protein
VYDNKTPEHTIAAVEKALYGLPTSANRWHTHLSDNLRSMGFKPRRFDLDVWLSLRGDKVSYNYIGTQANDLKIIAKCASHHMSTIREKYVVKGGSRSPSFHLGSDHQQPDEDNKWKIGTNF